MAKNKMHPAQYRFARLGGVHNNQTLNLKFFLKQQIEKNYIPGKIHCTRSTRMILQVLFYRYFAHFRTYYVNWLYHFFETYKNMSFPLLVFTDVTFPVYNQCAVCTVLCPLLRSDPHRINQPLENCHCVRYFLMLLRGWQASWGF